ncbi:MAG: hypothetical protein U0637_02565 [Phycisphaerales bacterium]
MTTPAAAPVEFRVALTADELAEGAVDLQMRTPAGVKAVRAMRKGALSFGGVALACVGGWVYKTWQDGWGWSFDGLCTLALVTGSLGVLMFRSVMPSAVRGKALKAAHNPAYAGLLREHTVRLSPEGFGLETSDSTTFNRWRLYEGVEVTGRFVLFPMADNRVHVLPVRAAGGPAAAAELAERCRGWIRADGGGEQRSVVAYLARHDTACPGCGYQLRNLPRAQCPECGTVLGRENLAQAFAV